MNEHQRETAFLKQVILYDDTTERHTLEEKITQAQRDERCVRRAIWLMVLVIALSVAGLSYSAIFLTDYPRKMSQFVAPFMSKVFCVLGLGALFCLLFFSGLGVAYRKELDRRREECRRLATKLLESRLGKPQTTPLSGMFKEQEVMAIGSKRVVPASEAVPLPGESDSQ
jgi:hypothetical protein